jgi:multidrug resistance efflux pump
MTAGKSRSKRAETPDDRGSAASSQLAPRRRSRLIPFLITLAVVALAVPLSWAMWSVYMETPWTRDGTVRVYVVTMAPQVAGLVVELHVHNNGFVHKGDLLMVIDPTNYRIAVSQAEAAVQQAQASIENTKAQIEVQQAQISANQAQLDRAQAALVFARQQAARYESLARTGFGSVQNAQYYTSQLQQQEAAVKSAQESLDLAQRQIEVLKAQRVSADANLAQAQAQLSQTQVNLRRTSIFSPVNGYVTNLLVQLGDYIQIGQSSISLVDADSFWVDGYFNETDLASIREGDPASIKLMGYSEVIRGHVDGIARGINVPNSQPNYQGLPDVNPIFTWVRLAQRIPVSIHIDQVPPGVLLSAGMTSTVQIEHRGRSPVWIQRIGAALFRTKLLN